MFYLYDQYITIAELEKILQDLKNDSIKFTYFILGPDLHI